MVIQEGASRGMGFALLASVTLDGMPENLALGASLSREASITLLIAIFASNFPESLVGAVSMRHGGQKRLSVVLIWTGAAVLLTLMVVVGSFAAHGDAAGLSAFFCRRGGDRLPRGYPDAGGIRAGQALQRLRHRRRLRGLLRPGFGWLTLYPR